MSRFQCLGDDMAKNMMVEVTIPGACLHVSQLSRDLPASARSPSQVGRSPAGGSAAISLPGGTEEPGGLRSCSHRVEHDWSYSEHALYGRSRADGVLTLAQKPGLPPLRWTRLFASGVALVSVGDWSRESLCPSAAGSEIAATADARKLISWESVNAKTGMAETPTTRWKHFKSTLAHPVPHGSRFLVKVSLATETGADCIQVTWGSGKFSGAARKMQRSICWITVDWKRRHGLPRKKQNK